ncbi:hypothetical protein MCAP1_000571 [Malassezia caprae]|uniref:Rad60/SUMO-like domain-containing protein n=1 Tax=Malassezia caprae TaxID=1381934 RepID=A0AAF0IU34_9BASI|nr:hypothetical protein MCAP1_000571 [Malassezia caprae]
MAGRPRPRARKKQASLDSGYLHGDAEDMFFIASRPRTSQVTMPEAEAPAAGDDEDDASRGRKRRKALSYDWVSQAESIQSSNTVSPEPVPPQASVRERSASVSPPPPELEEEARTYALRAIEQVKRQHTSRLAALDAALEGDELDPDTSLELNADLAQYYKGHDAKQLRERALARELDRQEQAHVMTLLDEEEPPAVPVYEVDDSSEPEDAPAPNVPDLVPEAAHAQDTPSPGTLLLTLRGARQLEADVRHFVSTHKDALAPHEASHAYVSFEGERIASTSQVQELDLEEGDMLDVMW